jgi:hypothetical protein
MARRHRLWRDGEFWTAALVGILSGLLFYWCPESLEAFRSRFGELLTVASIIFGFVLTALIFYIQAAERWSSDGRVGRVAEKLVDWHVWSILCLLLLMGCIVLVWLCKGLFLACRGWAAVSHGSLVFLASYCALQILNHTLTVRWVFRNRHTLRHGPGSGSEPGSHSDRDRP